MKVFLKKLSADLLRPINFRMTKGEKTNAFRELTEEEKKQRIILAKKKIADKGYMNHAADIAAHVIMDAIVTNKVDLNKL